MLGHRVNSEGLRGRANAPWRRRTQEDLYRVQLRFLSTIPSRKTPKKAAIFAGFCQEPANLSDGAASLAQDGPKTLDHRRISHLSAGYSVTRGRPTPSLAVLDSLRGPRPYLATHLAVHLAVLGPHSSADPCTIRRVSRNGGKRQHHLTFS